MRERSRNVNIYLFAKRERSGMFGAMKQQQKKRKNAAAVALGRLGGLKGGKARAQQLSATELSKQGKKAALARWKKR
jgi:hypothetical protein